MPAPHAIRDSAPVFIVGSMRSGTTLLRLMLNEHPDLALPPESHFLSQLFQRFASTPELDARAVGDAVAIVAASEPWQRDYAHDADELRAFVGAEPMTLAQFITAVFRLEVGPSVARWGDKTPHYLNQVRAIVTTFPQAQIIAIVRDPRDAYLSLAPRDWVGTSPWDVGRYLARNGRLIRRWRATYPESTFTVVRYEDLVLDTEAVLRALCGFLDLPFDPRMESFFRNAEHNVQPWELEIGAHDKLLRPPSAADVGRWKSEGSRVANREIEAIAAETIDDFDYERLLARRLRPVARATARVGHYARRPRELVSRIRATPNNPP